MPYKRNANRHNARARSARRERLVPARSTLSDVINRLALLEALDDAAVKIERRAWTSALRIDLTSVHDPSEFSSTWENSGSAIGDFEKWWAARATGQNSTIVGAAHGSGSCSTPTVKAQGELAARWQGLKPMFVIKLVG